MSHISCWTLHLTTTSLAELWPMSFNSILSQVGVSDFQERHCMPGGILKIYFTSSCSQMIEYVMKTSTGYNFIESFETNTEKSCFDQWKTAAFVQNRALLDELRKRSKVLMRLNFFATEHRSCNIRLSLTLHSAFFRGCNFNNLGEVENRCHGLFAFKERES